MGTNVCSSVDDPLRSGNVRRVKTFDQGDRRADRRSKETSSLNSSLSSELDRKEPTGKPAARSGSKSSSSSDSRKDNIIEPREPEVAAHREPVVRDDVKKPQSYSSNSSSSRSDRITSIKGRGNGKPTTRASRVTERVVSSSPRGHGHSPQHHVDSSYIHQANHHVETSRDHHHHGRTYCRITISPHGTRHEEEVPYGHGDFERFDSRDVGHHTSTNHGYTSQNHGHTIRGDGCYVKLTVKSADFKDDADGGRGNKQDPYVCFQYDGQEYQTRAVPEGGRCVTWNQEFIIRDVDRAMREHRNITFRAYDCDGGWNSDDYLGESESLNWANLQRHSHPQELDLQLRRRSDGSYNGVLRICVQYVYDDEIAHGVTHHSPRVIRQTTPSHHVAYAEPRAHHSPHRQVSHTPHAAPRASHHHHQPAGHVTYAEPRVSHHQPARHVTHAEPRVTHSHQQHRPAGHVNYAEPRTHYPSHGTSNYAQPIPRSTINHSPSRQVIGGDPRRSVSPGVIQPRNPQPYAPRPAGQTINSVPSQNRIPSQGRTTGDPRSGVVDPRTTGYRPTGQPTRQSISGQQATRVVR